MKSSLKWLWWTSLFGSIVLVIVGSPVIAAYVVYSVANHFGTTSAPQLAEWAGLDFLLLLATAMAGNALHTSLQNARKKEAPSEAKITTQTTTLANSDLIDIWKETIDVQQHFNDLELRIRNFAVTLIVAIIGATALALKEHYVIPLFGRQFPIAVAILVAGMLGWVAFYFMDRHWYHRLLLGAVSHTAEHIENLNIPELGLSKKIGEKSALPIWKLKQPKNRRTHWIEIRSSEKIDLFYSAGLLLLVILTMLLLGSTSIPSATPETQGLDFAAPKTTIETYSAPLSTGDDKNPREGRPQPETKKPNEK